MAREASPPDITPQDREAFAALLEQGEPLPCGGRAWAGPANKTGAPLFQLASDDTVTVSARRMAIALEREQRDGELRWPTKRVYTEHWGCITHLTFDRAKMAKPGAATQEPLPLTYVRAWAPDHPLATRSGYVLEHRAVLFDHLGAGLQHCHWCGRELTWDALPGSDDELTVDHLDWDRHNNDPANLVPACRSCNAARTRTATGSSPGSSGSSELPHDASEPTTADQVPSFQASEASESPEEGTEVEALEAAGSWWRRVRRNRWARALAVALLVAVAAGAAVTSPAAFLPGVQTSRRGGQEPPQERPEPAPAPELPGEPPGASTPAPTETAPSTTTTIWWTMPEPCTPAHCPTLDN